MPNFYKGYDKHLDITEEEYWEQKALDYFDEDAYYAKLDAEAAKAEAAKPEPIEGEPYEDAYLPGIPDWDIFNRPSWAEQE